MGKTYITYPDMEITATLDRVEDLDGKRWHVFCEDDGTIHRIESRLEGELFFILEEEQK